MAETMKGKTLLKGHTLVMEGDGYLFIRGEWERIRDNGDGCAKCRCGQASPILPSRAARQRWHREHKDAIREAKP